MVCCCSPVPGCTNPNAANYNAAATCDDGSCQTCCTEEKCRLSDDCKGLDCNNFTGSAFTNCCDSGCLPCDPPGDFRDCHTSFDNITTGGGNFVATDCDGNQIIYYDCYECPSAEVVPP